MSHPSTLHSQISARQDSQTFGLTAWEHGVVERRPGLVSVKREIRDSWQRAFEARVDPSLRRAPMQLAADELGLRLELPWVRLAQAVLLPHVESVTSSGHVLTVFDAQGTMLLSAGAAATLEQMHEIQFTPGARWDEQSVGTNGPGTALALRRPVHIIGAEHFCASFHRWQCAAVPLFDPRTRELLGALDISGDQGTAHPYVLSLASSLARNIEQALALGEQTQAGHKRSSSFAARAATPVHKHPTRYDLSDLTGSHPLLEEARRMVQVASANTLPVLLLGESGVGKEVVAQAIHAESARASRPFVAVNCGALPSELIESELFGYTAGAFSGAQRNGARGKFEAAEGGTLLLDEICELPALAQAALLRALQEQQITPVGATEPRAIDVRIIAATNRDPLVEIAAGRFRLDLYHRLHVLQIELPPLRARGDDLLVLAAQFLDAAEHETGRRVTLSEDVKKTLLAHDWPGNVRELENLMRRLSATARGLEVQPSDLPAAMRTPVVAPLAMAVGDEQEDPHKLELMSVIRSARTMAEAARRLGVTRSTLYRRLERFGLVPSRWVQDGAKR